MKYELNIAWLYPDLMSTYGDRGNVIVLLKRAQWRGIGSTIVPITLETSVNHLNECDLIFMGGAQDRQQKLAGEDFLGNKGPIVKSMVDRGVPALFVCAAYQFAGHYYRPSQGDDIPGAGIFDLATIHPGDQAKRLIGNVTAVITNLEGCEGEMIVGFENHGGRTHLGPKMKPLAKVQRGFGNNGEDGFEGAVYKHAIGSYFHGPILPKNPILADWLIAKALEMKYKKNIELKPLDDTLATCARDAIIRRL
ncbi:cobalamin biosynthesis protein CobQ [Candidatus Gottesmanbacteria bacterium RIFCSPLOWO2_01_FULL_46_9]|uniref:Lipid II isoglutaminyl synthase (glutamine-hydrolyzing) subunit GatD n=1 Tax=Candidatus Gottesmanbacteria bacterium RIFCSPLOWO2_01_FULL_46_9 TaxID=1798394 RepID=A0A1F6B0S0_9BACT|nr:MAG: cobalamin biosynthesis protein CobQ [Candidatus Gottesmanbacteria bacterium RIFCSPLOWO2_01_FULL_46_9]